MNRSLLISSVAVLASGVGACSAFQPYDYSAPRWGETAEAGISRQEREAREAQQRTVRCETMGQAARRDAPDCR